MDSFKAGDKVQILNPKRYQYEYPSKAVGAFIVHGAEPDKNNPGEVVAVCGNPDYYMVRYKVKDQTMCLGFHFADIIKISTPIPSMELKKQFALVFKGEPQRSFIKVGVMNSDESLTPDGTALFLAYLLKKNGDDFKTTVVDPILAENEKES